MSDFFEDEDEPGSGSVNDPVHDPWLHFTISSEGVAAPDEAGVLPAGLHGSWGCEDRGPMPSEKVTASCTGDPRADRDEASVLAEDLFRRRRRGDTASLSADEGRFPSLGKSLAGLVSCRVASSPLDSTSEGRDRFLRLPEVGDDLFGFRLRFPLGRGAFARVFLAEQSDLAGRPVVLKVSAIEGTEPQTLAQLQHTNIVPIYSAHEDPRSGLRAVCMPYFGGASLSSILEHLWSAALPPIRGSEFVAALQAVQSPLPGSFKNGVKIDLGSAMLSIPAPPRHTSRRALPWRGCTSGATCRRPPGSGPSSPRG